MSGDRFSRQSFLGLAGQEAIEQAVVGVAGLGGGGGHVVQQLAHVGILNYVVYDGDIAEESNLNRLVIASEADALSGEPKINLAVKRILAVQPKASVRAFKCRWQDKPEPLRGCDVVVGCVDSFSERQQLEACCRRYLIPLIDIGMDVHQVGEEPPRMGGQVLLSMPGEPCMFCLGFLTDEKLGREAARYGAAGPRPQVIWANGVLASAAIGVVVDLVTNWSRSLRGPVYLSYDGNSGTLTPHPRLVHLPQVVCVHYPPDQIGDPVFSKF